MKSILPFMLAFLSLNTMAQLSPLEPFHANHPLFNTSLNNTQNHQRSNMQQLDSTTSKMFDTWSAHWRDWSTTNYEYYPNGTLKRYTSETPNQIREVLTFNEIGRISEHKFYQYHPAGHFWDSVQTTKFYYDAQNRQITDSSFVWNNTIWEPYGYTHITYTPQGYVDQRTYYFKQMWSYEPVNQFTFHTDTAGNLIGMENKQWVLNQWEPRNYYHHAYDHKGRRTEYSYDVWNGTSYTPDYKELFTYTNDNLTQQTMSFWDNGSWALSEYITFQYNLLEDNSSIYLPNHYMHNKNKLIGQQLYSYTTWGGAQVMDSTFFHYSEHSSGTPTAISEQQKSIYSVVQNPVANQIILETSEPKPTNCAIYALTGQLVYQKPLTNPREVIDVTFLQTGIYIIQLNDGSANSSLRILKQ